MAKRGKAGKPASGKRRYPIGFKQQAVGRMRSGENVSKLAEELGVNRCLLYLWKRKMQGRPYGNEPSQPADLRDQKIQELEAKIAELEGALGRKGQEVDFFEAALRRIAETRRKRSGSGGRESTKRSEDVPNRKAD